MDNRQDPLKRIRTLLSFHQNGLTITDIAGKLDLNRNSTAKYLEMMRITGDICLNTVGPAKIYQISHKMPISAMLKFSADFILLIDKNLRILDVNDNALTVLGHTRQDLIGADIREIKSGLISRLSIPEVFREIQESGEVQREFVYSSGDEDHHYRARLIPTVFDNQDEGLTIIGEDITEQIRFEERLMVSEARFRAIVEDQTEFICRWKPDGMATFINESLSRYLGIACNAICGQNIVSFIFSEDQALVRERIDLLKSTRDVQSAEIRVKDRDGQYRWHQWVSRGIFDSGGTLIECQSVGRDVTELKQSQEALRQNELLYRTILDNIQDVYYRSDKDGNLVMASPSILTLLGYDSLQKLLGQDIAEKMYYLPKDREKFLAVLYEKGRIADYEVTLKKRDGSPVIVSTNSQVLYDAAGNRTGIEGILRDISFRKQAEQALRESEEKFRTVVEHSLDGILIVDLTGRILFRNQAAVNLVESQKISDDAVTRNVTEYLVPEIREKIIHDFGQDTHGPDSYPANYHIVKMTGQKIWVESIGKKIVFGDTPAILVSVRDITIRKRAEQALLESEERFRMITELSPFPIAIIDKDGNFRYVNRKFESLFGYTLADIPTRQDWIDKAFHDDGDRAAALSTWEKHLDPSQPEPERSRTFPVTCRDGSVRTIRFYPITLDNRERFVAFEDLTDKTESDRLRSVIASIVNSSNDVIIGKTLDGIILSWNKAAERQYGYLAEEVIGKNINIIIPQELQDQLALLLKRVGSGESIERFTTVRLKKNGTRIEVSLNISPITDDEGHIIGISTVSQSIADISRAEVNRIFRQQVLHRR